MNQKIWLITGISSGLGKSLAEAVISHGDFVVGTFRQQEQADAFNNQHSETAFALPLDLTQPDQTEHVVAAIRARFGRIDVLVNNAGVGFAGAVEEASTDEVRAIFEANFFGTLRLTQAVLPLMRQQRSGHVVQMSSHSGVKGFPGFGIYSASKFALEGFSEALAAEVSPLGIRVTLVEPGPFRTDFAGRSFQEAARQLPDYEATAGAFRARMKQVNGQQEGDPTKAAQAIMDLVSSNNPPLRMPLGKIAVATLTAKIESVQRDLDAGREVAMQAVY